MRKILLIYGGPSGEHEVSLKSADIISRNLDVSKYDVYKVLIHKDETWQFLPDDKKLDLGQAISHISAEHFDAAAFIAVHGLFGEDGRLQALLEGIHLPYTGSSSSVSAIAMDKSASNLVYASAGLMVSSFVTLNITDKLYKIETLKFPVIVKPLRGGSSIGLSKVENKDGIKSALDEGFKHDENVIIQEFVKGREITCGVLEDQNGMPFALPPTEIISAEGGLFDYKAKYVSGASKEITPPGLAADKIKEVQDLAVRAHRVLGCSGISRSDFILKDDSWYILETNTIPGMTETSLIPQEAKAAGISPSELLDIVIASALRNHGK